MKKVSSSNVCHDLLCFVLYRFQTPSQIFGSTSSNYIKVYNMQDNAHCNGSYISVVKVSYWSVQQVDIFDVDIKSEDSFWWSKRNSR